MRQITVLQDGASICITEENFKIMIVCERCKNKHKTKAEACVLVICMDPCLRQSLKLLKVSPRPQAYRSNARLLRGYQQSPGHIRKTCGTVPDNTQTYCNHLLAEGFYTCVTFSLPATSRADLTAMPRNAHCMQGMLGTTSANNHASGTTSEQTLLS